MPDGEKLLEKMIQLDNEGLHPSAEYIGNFLLSAHNPGSSVHCATLEAFGDVMFNRKQYKRALNYLSEALQSRRGSKQQTSDADLKFRIAKCHVELGEKRMATQMIDSIPSRFRTPVINMMLGKLNQGAEVERAAISAYKEVLRANPWAIEAVIALQELGASSPQAWEALESLNLPQHWQGGGGEVSAPWLAEALNANKLAETHDHRSALEAYNQLSLQHPNNITIMLNQAKSHMLLGNYEDSQRLYQDVRKKDACNLDGMDLYASTIIRGGGTAEDLNCLARETMDVDNSRPEPWTTAALYSDLKGDKEKAMTFAEKAIVLDKRHVCSYVVYGYLCHSLGHVDKAITAYRMAHRIKREILVFQGLVEAYLGAQQPKVREALAMAKEALQLMKNDPKALTLIGLVLMHTQEGKEKARKAFENALRFDPHCTDAILALVQLEASEDRTTEAIQLLRRHLEIQNNEMVRTELAGLLVTEKKYTEALMHYHAALSMNKNYEQAQVGLDRLQKVMKGIDPDAEDEEEVDEDEIEEESFGDEE